MTGRIRALAFAAGCLLTGAALVPSGVRADGPSFTTFSPNTARAQSEAAAALNDTGLALALSFTFPNGDTFNVGHDSDVSVRVTNNRALSEQFTLSVRPDQPDPTQGAVSVQQVVAQPNGWGCQVNQGALFCSAATLPAGGSASVTFSIHPLEAGRDAILAITASSPDPANSNPLDGDYYLNTPVGSQFTAGPTTHPTTCLACGLQLPAPLPTPLPGTGH
jgi:hypothetical protein